MRREFRRRLPVVGAIGGIGAMACGLAVACVLSFQGRHVNPDQVASSDFAGSPRTNLADDRPVERQTHVVTTDGRGVETRTPLVVGAAFAEPGSKPAVVGSSVGPGPARSIQPSMPVAPAVAAFADEPRSEVEGRWAILHEEKRSQFQSIKARSTGVLSENVDPLVDDVPPAVDPEAIPVPTAKAARTEGNSDARRTTKVVRSVNLRSKPGGRGIGTIKRGTVVSVGRCDEWCEVVAGDRKGFVYRRFLGRIS